MTHIDPDKASILRLQTPPLLCTARSRTVYDAQPLDVGMEIGKLLPLLCKLLDELLVDLALLAEIGAHGGEVLVDDRSHGAAEDADAHRLEESRRGAHGRPVSHGRVTPQVAPAPRRDPSQVAFFLLGIKKGHRGPFCH